MTKEQKDKILKALADDRNDYARECNRRIAEENGKITGADYMLQRFLDVLKTEVEPQESEDYISRLDKMTKEIEEVQTYDDIYIDRAYVLEIIDKFIDKYRGKKA